MKKYLTIPNLLVISVISLFIICGYFYLKIQNFTKSTIKPSDKEVTINPTPIPTDSPEEVSQMIIKLVNDERVNKGLKPLNENSLLNKSAKLKLDDMTTKDYFEHISPAGTTPWFFFQKAGYKYRYAGENLANYQTSAFGAVNAWMNSDTHRADILNKYYVDTGVAVVYEQNGLITAVQHFGTVLTKNNNPVTNTINTTPSRTGNIVSYHDWCNNKDTSVYENEIVVRKSSDGNTYGMTVDDWNCYEKFLSSRR